MAAALRLVVTAAGYAALRNAAGDGTNEVRVATIGLTDKAFTPGGPLPTEIKRVATIKGGATAADTIHVTISDDGADVYSVRGFALYLTDGTRLASYGQPSVIVEKSGQASMLISFDVKFDDIDATQITFGDTNFNNPAATTERVGVVELATDDETLTGDDPQRVVTPRGLRRLLDFRFGDGAPSAFVKSLLLKLSASEFAKALGLRGAATYDTGHGNGLDADKLDGQHGDYYLDFANARNLPATWTPSDHKHSANDITSGILPVARGGTGTGTLDDGSVVIGGGAGALRTVSTDKFLTYVGAAPTKHSHIITDVIGLTDALAGKADRQHTHGMGDITGLSDALAGKAPTAHTHTTAQVAGLDAALAAKVSAAGPTTSGTLTHNAGRLGNSAGGALIPLSIKSVSANSDEINLYLYRYKDGAGWDSCHYVLRRDVDGSSQGSIVFGQPSSGTAIGLSDGAGSGVNIGAGGTLSTDGAVKVRGQITGSQNIGSSSSNLVLFSQASGNIYLRPNGENNGAGQISIDYGGGLYMPGQLNTGGRIMTNGISVVYQSDYSSSRGDTGWIRYPDGTIEQWGIYYPDHTWSEGSGPTITFPRAFPNACRNVILTDTNDGAAGYDFVDCTAQLTVKSNTYFATYIQNPSSNGRNNWRGMSWRAIGD